MKKALLIFIIFSLPIFLAFKYLTSKPPLKKSQPLLASRIPVRSAKRKSAAAQGKQTYSITQAHHSPNFIEAVIDPEDVRIGQKQTMTVTLSDEKAPITEVVAEIQTDNGIIKNPLIRISGSDQKGVWEGSWIVKDTHDTTYVTTFKAVNKIGEKGEARLSWTDPGCTTDANHGTAVTITSNCTISGIDGADGGRFTINSTSNGTVTIAAGGVLSANDLEIVAGNLVKNNDSGVISIVSGSVICMTDGDADGYPLNTTQWADGSACQGGRRQRSVMTAITTLDCNDGAYSTTNSCGCWKLSPGGSCDAGCNKNARVAGCGGYFVSGTTCSTNGTGSCYKNGSISDLCFYDSIGQTTCSSCNDLGYGSIQDYTATTCIWE